MNFFSILIDVIIVVLAYLIIRHSAKIGAAKTLVQLTGFIVVVGLVFTVGDILTDYIYDSFVKDKIVTSVSEQINESVDGYTDNFKSALPDYIIEVGEFIGIDIDEKLNESKSNNTSEVVIKLEENILQPVIKSIIKFALMIILILISAILIKALSKLTLVINKIPIIGTANKGLGLVFGAAKALLVLMVVCSLVLYLTKQFDWWVTPQILNKTFIFKYLCDINFLF